MNIYITEKDKHKYFIKSQFINLSEYSNNKIPLPGEIGSYLGNKIIIANNQIIIT
jgi:hypothetical protein